MAEDAKNRTIGHYVVGKYFVDSEGAVLFTT